MRYAVAMLIDLSRESFDEPATTGEHVVVARLSEPESVHGRGPIGRGETIARLAESTRRSRG